MRNSPVSPQLDPHSSSKRSMTSGVILYNFSLPKDSMFVNPSWIVNSAPLNITSIRVARAAETSRTTLIISRPQHPANPTQHNLPALRPQELARLPPLSSNPTFDAETLVDLRVAL
jgi:hypothetical protein